MIYNDFQGLKLSSLGFGCMRFPKNGEADKDIDFDKTKEMIAYAMEHGVNYYDTAWGYHDGESEIVLGKILKDYPRDSYYISDKFPGYDKNNFGKVEEIFYAQLEKTGFQYFDFYHCHNLSESNLGRYLDDETYHTVSFLKEMKKKGLIKHLGFSAHAEAGSMRTFLEAYGNDMEFGQIQLNFFDWKFQHAKEKVDLLNEYHIPIWVMEPVRGGNLLLNMGDDREARLKALRPNASNAEFCFRFVQSIPNVTVTLSGMTTMDQLKENVETFNEYKPLNDDEMKVLLEVGDEIIMQKSTPCTACRYCTTHCPQGLDIPAIIKLYDEHKSNETGMNFIAPMVFSSWPKEKRPSACTGCGSCYSVCPQEIDTPSIMKFLSRR